MQINHLEYDEVVYVHPRYPNIFNFAVEATGDKTCLLWKVMSLHCTSKTMVRTTSISWVCLQTILWVPLPALHPSFPIRVIIQNLTVHPEHDFASACAHNFVTDLNELHQWLQQHIAKANIDTRHLLNSDDHQPQNSKWKPSICQGSIFHTTQPSKKLSDKFLGPYESLAHPGTHSVTLRLPHDFRAVQPGILCLNVGTSIPKSISESNSTYTPTPHYWRPTQIQNFWHPWHQDWQLMSLQTSIFCPMDGLWRHWRRNLLDQCQWAQKCYWTCCGHSLGLPIKPGLSQIFEVQTTSLLLKFSHLLQVQQNLIIPSK